MKVHNAMIVNRTESGWAIIYQRAHALLAAKLITPWRADQRPLRWTETLNATAQHDNGWQEWEPGDRLTAAGAPRHYTEVPVEMIASQAARVVTRAWHQSLWVGLLVSRHVSHLYEPRRGESDRLDEVLDTQIELRDRWRSALGSPREEVERAYALLLWGDTLSLILCTQQLPFGGRALEISHGPDGRRHHVRQRADESLAVEPWPYELDEFTVAVDVHEVAQLKFADEEELAASLASATATRWTWRLAEEPLGN